MLRSYPSNNEFRPISDRKFDEASFKSKNTPTSVSNMKIGDYEKIIISEIQAARNLLQKLKLNSIIESSNKDSKLIAKLRSMEEVINRKNLVIRELEFEIGMLKNNHKEVNEPLENKINNLTSEIKQSCNEIEDLELKIQNKKTNYAKKSEQIKGIFEKYVAKCKKQQVAIVDLQKFKVIEQTRRKEQLKIERMKQSKKKLSSINESQNRKLEEEIKRNGTQNKTIRECIARKSVAETALKNERKKHRHQMNNFMSKIQFLKDQDAQLQFKIKAKLVQLQNAQKKFTQNYNMNSSNKPARLKTTS